jgi:hypothetical protein
MSDLTALCDELKSNVRTLEEENEKLKGQLRAQRDELNNTQRDLTASRTRVAAAEESAHKNCDTKMELLRLLKDTADHLRVSSDGTNSDVAHRIWAKVNELRKGNSEFLLEVAQATGADTTGTCRNVADSILVQFSKLKEECGRDQRNATKSQAEAAKMLNLLSVVSEAAEEAMGYGKPAGILSGGQFVSRLRYLGELRAAVEEVKKTYDVDGIPALNTYIEHQLGAVTELKEHIDVLKADHQAAIEGRDKELNDALGELKGYHKAYKELEKATVAAMAKVGLRSDAEPYTVQAQVLQALERLSEAAFNDTVDSRLKKLEQVCYAAESRSGVMCREENPWQRIRYVLENMAAEIARLKVNKENAVSPLVYRRINELMVFLGADGCRQGAWVDEASQAIAMLDAIQKKVKEAQNSQVPEEVLRKLWAVLQNLDAKGADMAMAGEGGEWSTDIGKALALTERIAQKAYEGQNIKAACLKLKELL